MFWKRPGSATVSLGLIIVDRCFLRVIQVAQMFYFAQRLLKALARGASHCAVCLVSAALAAKAFDTCNGTSKVFMTRNHYEETKAGASYTQ